MDVFDIEPDQCIEISAKSGLNVDHVLRAVVEQIPSPKAFTQNEAGWCFDVDVGGHTGNRFFVRNIGNKALSKGVKITPLNGSKTFAIKGCGICKPEPTLIDSLLPGQIGFIIASSDNPSALLGNTLLLPGLGSLFDAYKIIDFSRINLKIEKKINLHL